MQNPRTEIQRILDGATQEIVEIVQRLVVETVQARLGDLTEDLGSRSGAATDKRVLRRRRCLRVRYVKGAKRTQAELEALTTRLAAYIAKNPGLRRADQPRPWNLHQDLALPIKKLIADKVIKSRALSARLRTFPVKG